MIGTTGLSSGLTVMSEFFLLSRQLEVEQVLQLLAQCYLGPVETRFDGFLGTIHHFSNCGVREIVVFGEHDGSALVFG